MLCGQIAREMWRYTLTHTALGAYQIRRKQVNKCKECEGQLYPLDTDDHECKCGAMYCGDCDTEFNKDGEILSYGRVML